MSSMFFDGWSGLLRVLLVGTLAYVALIAFLRISGKRTLTKLNAFDLVITVALGSTLSSIVLTKSVALFEGLLALFLLIGLQYVITWLSVRSTTIQHVIKAEPTLLLHRGKFLEDALLRQRVTRDDVLAAIRNDGLAEVDSIAAVVLETDGSMSVLPQSPESGRSAGSLAGIAAVDRTGRRRSCLTM
ncbi:Membrane protein-like protein [Bradyrhizobium sp. ORS 375]|uniref:DUF421 domain-containing protein n=1 Tax=Bradyrhizobium sp. (strain ORS 375) TaxID=566679 RepID=UPI0002409095|nr:YetF domain-containing protein [Bradyrhizobium sp. ORS 375]CCD91584.1 Membrane protein-like protein [Bradyrhizobium sp. ORS 375]